MLKSEVLPCENKNRKNVTPVSFEPGIPAILELMLFSLSY